MDIHGESKDRKLLVLVNSGQSFNQVGNIFTVNLFAYQSGQIWDSFYDLSKV